MNFANCSSFCSGMTQEQRHQGHRKWFRRPTDAVSHPPACGPSERQDIAVPGPWFGTIPRLSSFSLSRAACYARAGERRVAFFSPVFRSHWLPILMCLMFCFGPSSGLQQCWFVVLGDCPCPCVAVRLLLLAIKSMFGQQLACAIHSLYGAVRRTDSRREDGRTARVAECNHFY